MKRQIEKSSIKKSRNPQYLLSAGRWRRQTTTQDGNVPFQTTAEANLTPLEERSPKDAVCPGRQQVHHLQDCLICLDNLNTIALQVHLLHRQPVDQDQRQGDEGAPRERQISKEFRRTPVMLSSIITSPQTSLLFSIMLTFSRTKLSSILNTDDIYHYSVTGAPTLKSDDIRCPVSNSIQF